MSVAITGWEILKGQAPDLVIAPGDTATLENEARADIEREVRALPANKIAKYVDQNAPDLETTMHLWQIWASSPKLKSVHLRPMAKAVKDTIPAVQVLVMTAWCAVTDLTQYTSRDGKYPERNLCPEAYQVLCDRQNYQCAFREGWLVASQGYPCQPPRVNSKDEPLPRSFIDAWEAGWHKQHKRLASVRQTERGDPTQGTGSN